MNEMKEEMKRMEEEIKGMKDRLIEQNKILLD